MLRHHRAVYAVVPPRDWLTVSNPPHEPIMADAAPEKRRTFRKYSYRGVDLDQLLDMNPDELVNLFHARARRK